MISSRNQIIKYCEEYLKVKDFQDYCCNGLQVEGKREVKKIITGVSFSERLIKEAIKRKADMIMVHHGIFNDAIGSPAVIKGFTKNRLKLLLENDINLAGFHLPLDAHPLIGNNISLCRLLGVKNPKPFDIGFMGEIDKTVSFKDFQKIVDKKLGVRSDVIAAGNKQTKKVAIISGGASPEFILAAELGADTYICGDIRESVVRAIEETGINFINAGHYNTEKLGIQNLGELVSKKFRVKVEFVDVPCEI